MKLLPREVSNGLGRGEGLPVLLDVAVSMLAVELPVAVALALLVIVFVGVATSVVWIMMVGSTSVEEGGGESSISEVGVASGAAVEPKGSELSCLGLMTGLVGRPRRSIAISPRLASRLNCEESYA